MHVTEIRSAQCKRISEQYQSLAARSKELNLPDADTYASLAQQYAKDADDLISGQASPPAIVMAIATADH